MTEQTNERKGSSPRLSLWLNEPRFFKQKDRLLKIILPTHEIKTKTWHSRQSHTYSSRKVTVKCLCLAEDQFLWAASVNLDDTTDLTIDGNSDVIGNVVLPDVDDVLQRVRSGRRTGSSVTVLKQEKHPHESLVAKNVSFFFNHPHPLFPLTKRKRDAAPVYPKFADNNSKRLPSPIPVALST